eukprot:TRINITY_DN132_c0_g1_i8.p1 TRINITY_DN132_c0_g1~~TRINITY_DN132_c0_g1_i8.p1  ORF type:complete len:645 (+),score=116.03 TRINITY_DN132_c0_g1_i8:568-2502(+)
MIKLLGTPFDEQNLEEVAAYEQKIIDYFKENDTEERFSKRLNAFNRILGTSFKPADSRKVVTASQSEVVSIILFVLRNVARHKTVALFLDELQHMSEYGWSLTSSIAKAIKDSSIDPKNQMFKGVTMICASRDLFNVKFTPRFQPANEHYGELRRKIAHEVINLRNLNTKEVTNYLKIFYNAENICPLLLDFVMDRTGGNPRFCSLLANNLPMEVTKVRGLTKLAFSEEFEKQMQNEFWSEVPADISSIVMDGVDRVDARKMILLKSCATILRGNPRYPLVFDSSALEAVHPVPEYIPYLAQDLACLVQANFLVDVTHIRRQDRRTFLVKKRLEDSLAQFNGIMGLMDQALLTEGTIKDESVPMRKRLPQERRTLDPFAGRERSMGKFPRPTNSDASTQHSYNEEESEESTVQLDEEDPGDLSVSTIQSRRRESMTELFTIKRVSQSGQSPSESRSKTRLINTSYWEARICFIKEEWFWWTDSALDEENALGRVCFRDEDTDFGMDSKNPFIYIRDKDVTYTFKSTPHSMTDWQEALVKAKEIGIQKRTSNEPIQKDPPAFSQLKSTYLFNEKPPYKTKFYAFNSGYLRDVVYNLMLFKQRELVHGSCIAFFKEKYEDPRTQNTKKKKYRLRGRSSETAKAHRG